MARLPQAADLQRRTAPAQTPAVKVGAIDFKPAIDGEAAIGKGVGEIAKFGMDYADQQRKADEQIDDFEMQKRLLDFKYQTEMELDERRRQMPVGGTGYTDGWAKSYRDRARSFVGSDDGEKDRLIPPQQRAKVGMALKQWEVTLQERAKRDENAERDRYTIDGLERTVGAHRSRVEADPTKHDEVQSEVGRLIEMAPIPPAQRDAYRRKVRESVSEAAANAYADRAVTAAGREEAKRLLAPSAPDRRAVARTAADPNDVLGSANRFFLDKGLAPHQAAAIAGNMRWESGGKPDLVNPNDNVKNSPNSPHSIGIGQWNDRAPALLDFARSRGVEIPDGNLRDVNYARAVAKAIPLDVQLEFAWAELQTTEKGAFDRIRNAGDLRTASEGAIGYHRPAGWTRGNPSAGHGFVNRVALAEQALKSGAKPSSADGGYMDAGMEPAYAGPFAELPLAKRRAIDARAEAVFTAEIGKVQTLIKEQMKASEQGVLPPQAWLDAVGPRVERINDPTTAALYATMVGKAEVTARVRELPPTVQMADAQRLRENLTASGGTAEQVQYVEHREKLAAEARRQVAENPIGWAARNRPPVPIVESPDPEATRLVAQGRVDEAMVRFPGQYARPELAPLNFAGQDIAGQLDKRMTEAKAIARYNGAPVVAFAPNEKDMLGNVMKQGGAPMLVIMGHVAAAAERANVDASTVLKQVAGGDAPEVAMIGHLVANRGDKRTLDVAAEALKWKIGQGEKFESTIIKTRAQPTLGDYDKLFAGAPTARDSLKSLANLVYEYRARQEGVPSTEFRQPLYTEIVRKIMGETTDTQGQTFGGAGYQHDSLFDGMRRTPVLVPPAVKQDRFDDMIGALRADDLVKAGGIPTDVRGNAYSMTEIRNMSWQSIGPPGSPPVPGLYVLKVKDDPGGRPVYAFRGSPSGAGSPRAAQETGDPVPIVLDLRPVMGEIQKRKPSIFMGHQVGIEHDQTLPDPAYPTGFGPIAKPVPVDGAPEPRTGKDRRGTPIGRQAAP